MTFCLSSFDVAAQKKMYTKIPQKNLHFLYVFAPPHSLSLSLSSLTFIATDITTQRTTISTIGL